MEGEIKWTELLEKFRSVQEKARRHHVQYIPGDAGTASSVNETNIASTPSLQPSTSSLQPSSLPPVRVPTPSGRGAATNAVVSENVTKGRHGLGIGRLGGAARKIGGKK